MDISNYKKLLVHQTFEAFELLGFETRNKYQVLDENQNQIAFAAEQQKGLMGFIARSFLGHWRKFDIKFFDMSKSQFMSAHHPFRFFFQRLEVKNNSGQLIGALQQRFSIFSKKFDLLDGRGRRVMKMRSPIWKIWTFPFYINDREVGRIEKKWSGIMSEAFTDKDKFLINYASSSITEEQKMVILASAVFIDLQYFEKKAGNN